MTSLLDLPNNPPALFILVIAVGFILIIIAAVPSLSVFILKNAGLTLNKRQSIMVAAIGGVLIIIGSVGVVGLNQLERAPTGEVFIKPEPPVTVLSNGIPLNISVIISDPNIFQKIFDEPEELKFTFLVLDSNRPLNRYEWTGKYNYSQFNLSPEDAGNKIIEINVTDTSKDKEYNIYRRDYNIILPLNKPPIIKNVSYKPKEGDGMEITVDAEDPENDEIYYDFKLISLSVPNLVSEIQPPSGDYRENSRVLTSGKNGTGKSLLRVYIKDGSEKGPMKGPFGDRKPVFDTKWDKTI
jgi:hypothetical protein